MSPQDRRRLGELNAAILDAISRGMRGYAPTDAMDDLQEAKRERHDILTRNGLPDPSPPEE
jgi:hypothetical protein